ncbi:hypothetical protein SK128_014068 [Halocaridina rubra]|uniref:Uncharacterized protein n=1 Tax=Halocaridina rubra TaxID=373956 RepID=A0AAN8XR88_HALRR
METKIALLRKRCPHPKRKDLNYAGYKDGTSTNKGRDASLEDFGGREENGRLDVERVECRENMEEEEQKRENV